MDLVNQKLATNCVHSCNETDMANLIEMCPTDPSGQNVIASLALQCAQVCFLPLPRIVSGNFLVCIERLILGIDVCNIV